MIDGTLIHYETYSIFFFEPRRSPAIELATGFTTGEEDPVNCVGEDPVNC